MIIELLLKVFFTERMKNPINPLWVVLTASAAHPYSTIKAIANHTKRHIVSVSLNKIKTAKELLNVFYGERMNYKEIPMHQRLYILEDIDAADLKDVVGERSTVENDEEKRQRCRH